eukprot:6163443-Pleurochrysis_carterae.AAC.2
MSQQADCVIRSRYHRQVPPHSAMSSAHELGVYSMLSLKPVERMVVLRWDLTRAPLGRSIKVVMRGARLIATQAE